MVLNSVGAGNLEDGASFTAVLSGKLSVCLSHLLSAAVAMATLVFLQHFSPCSRCTFPSPELWTPLLPLGHPVVGGKTLAVPGVSPSGLNLSSLWPAQSFMVAHQTPVTLSVWARLSFKRGQLGASR